MTLKRRPPTPNSKQQSGETECCCSDPSLTSIDDLAADPLDVLVLNLSRAICFGYAHEAVGPWDHAISMAEEIYSEDQGAILMAHVATLIRAVRSERNPVFSFMPIGCRRMTYDEECLLRVVQSARRRDGNPERMLLLALVSRVDAHKCLAALKRLANWACEHGSGEREISARLSSARATHHGTRSLN